MGLGFHLGSLLRALDCRDPLELRVKGYGL